MTTTLPSMNAYGKIQEILDKAALAIKPQKFTQSFLETKLNCKSTSDRAIIPLLIRMGFLSSDRTTTSLYSEFKNPTLKGTAIAKGMRTAFKDIFDMNLYAYDASDAEIEGYVTQITGFGSNDKKVKTIAKTFQALKNMADFENEHKPDQSSEMPTEGNLPPLEGLNRSSVDNPANGLKFSYTINLNLPETSDIEVFDAIFSSVKKHFYSGD